MSRLVDAFFGFAMFATVPAVSWLRTSRQDRKDRQFAQKRAF